LKPQATIRKSPADFIVDEIPAFDASGEGEHLFCASERRTSRRTMRYIAFAARSASMNVAPGNAGMKDKRAVATQTLSIPFSLSRSVGRGARARPRWHRDRKRGARHRTSSSPVTSKANRFTIVLRDLLSEEVPGVVEELERAGRQGSPTRSDRSASGAR
jgi:tRNA pseudouridine13 synthase